MTHEPPCITETVDALNGSMEIIEALFDVIESSGGKIPDETAALIYDKGGKIKDVLARIEGSYQGN